MASVRERNGRFYFRVTIRQNGKYKYIERGSFATYEEAYLQGNKLYPAKRRKKNLTVTDHLADLIFKKYPEGSEQFLPLFLIYYLGASVEEAYSISEEEINFKERRWLSYKLDDESLRILKRHIKKLEALQIPLRYKVYEKRYLVVRIKTGKRISPYQMDYITKCIRREINPEWNPKQFVRKPKA